MKIGVMSDTHGNVEFLRDAANFLVRGIGVDRIFHLGDNYADAGDLASFGVDVVRVPGLYCNEYRDESIPNKVMEKVDSISLLLVHDENDLEPEDLSSADVILVGHSHNWRVRKQGRVILFNPGHLKEAYHKNRIATLGLLEVEGDTVKISVYDYRGKLLRTFTR